MNFLEHTHRNIDFKYISEKIKRLFTNEYAVNEHLLMLEKFMPLAENIEINSILDPRTYYLKHLSVPHP